MRIHAPAKLNLCLYLGPRREDGLHELCSLFEPLALADPIEVAEAERDEVVCPGVEGENLAARALAGAARARLGAAAAADRDREADPGRRRPRRRQRRRGRGPAARRAARSPTSSELAAELGADVPSQLRPGAGAGARAPASGSSACPSRPPHAVVLLPGGGGLSTAAVFAEADRLGLGREPRSSTSWRRACARR